MNITTTVPFIVGAYAAHPADAESFDEFYRLLALEPWITGLEVPFPGDLMKDPRGVAARLAPGWTSVLTLIPGTMQRVGADPSFGLASPDEDGRQAALEFADVARSRLAELADVTGRPAVGTVLLHSAPSGKASADAFRRSLDDLGGRDWSGADLAIEHCDRFDAERPYEKGFLPLDAELTAAHEAGVGIHVNWGRSYLDERDPEAPLAHVRAAAEAGLLVGVVFSGASSRPTQYGGAWADGHLPMSSDEPASALTATRVAACAAAAQASPALRYLGAKACVPAESTPQARVDLLRRIYLASRTHPGS